MEVLRYPLGPVATNLVTWLFVTVNVWFSVLDMPVAISVTISVALVGMPCALYS